MRLLCKAGNAFLQGLALLVELSVRHSSRLYSTCLLNTTSGIQRLLEQRRSTGGKVIDARTRGLVARVTMWILSPDPRTGKYGGGERGKTPDKIIDWLT